MANRAEPAAGRWLTGIQNLLQQQATPYDDDPFAFAERVVRDRLPADEGERWSVVTHARQHPS